MLKAYDNFIKRKMETERKFKIYQLLPNVCTWYLFFRITVVVLEFWSYNKFEIMVFQFLLEFFQMLEKYIEEWRLMTSGISIPEKSNLEVSYVLNVFMSRLA